MIDRADISERTGFDSGDQFTSPEDVRGYFRRESLLECVMPPADQDIPDQDYLDAAAEAVIDNHWHCAF